MYVCRPMVTEPIHMKQAPIVPGKGTAAQPSSTHYSKRLAAAKALKQSKGNGLPTTLLKTK